PAGRKAAAPAPAHRPAQSRRPQPRMRRASARPTRRCASRCAARWNRTRAGTMEPGPRPGRRPTPANASSARQRKPGCGGSRTTRAACCGPGSGWSTNAAAARGQTEAMKRFPCTLLPLLVLLALTLAPAAHAETRAWLDRDRIQAGETATLNVETDQAGVSTPDWSPLEADFEVSGHTSTRRVEMVNGDTRVRSLFAVALRPRSEGRLEVPALRVGREQTGPLALTVLPAQDPPAQAGAVAFIETELDTGQAWVQQAVGYVLRLHYATPLVSGELEQPQPEGASLQRIGDDLQYSREIGGRRYNVVERRFLLVPERSGTLEIPAARFRGRGTGSFFDVMFGSGPRTRRAGGEPRRVRVQPMPAGAPRPWLPLRGLEARFLDAPQSARAGEAGEVVVELRADGATAAQMPDPELRAGD